jgi:hypothetical protein
MSITISENDKRRLESPMSVPKNLLDPNDDNVGAVLLSAVRYALGRRTYMPGIVVGVILPKVQFLNDKTLCCMERDIVDQEQFGYGDDCDKKDWMRLLEAVKAEREKRGLEAWR